MQLGTAVRLEIGRGVRPLKLDRWLKAPRLPMATQLQRILVAVVLVWALVLRVQDLHLPLFAPDEAESTINALTILEHSYPTDRYLGLPLFENTLILRWPESPEYEFRDSSYSARGVAVYHGWLPLYSIAASLAAFGIEPDRASPELAIRHSDTEMDRMTVAARTPSVLFGMLAVLLIALLAREIYGTDAAWAALIVSACSDSLIDFSRYARYYSATVALSTACCVLLWRILTRGRWRDYAIASVLFGALFHAHPVTYLIVCVVFGLTLPWQTGTDRLLWKLALFTLVVAALTLPWAVVTGFLGQASGIPPARHFLVWPQDLLIFLRPRLPTFLLLSVGVSVVVLAHAFGRRLPPRLTAPCLERRGAIYLLAAWVVTGYVGFALLMPAGSYASARVVLPLLGPCLALAAILMAVLGRVVTGRQSPLLAASLYGGFMALSGNLQAGREGTLGGEIRPIVDWLRRHPFQPGTRVYATPNKHLTFTAYTGLPVQSVAPVRKSFLDSYPGEILIIETSPYRPIHPDLVSEAASRAGVPTTTEDVSRLAWVVTSRAIRERLRGRVAEIHPPLEVEDVPTFLRPLVEQVPRQTEERLRDSRDPSRSYPIIFRDRRIVDHEMWWVTYFYRFVDPDGRSGSQLNYLERVGNAQAWVFSAGTLYLSPGPVRAPISPNPAS